jgi:D-alanyl-D-alanine carboxypeptidase (penicillin-binding protein 5/6)
MVARRSLERASRGMLVLLAALVLLGGRSRAAPVAMAYELTDYGSGIAVLERNSDQRRYPASLTKMLTALILMETLPADATIKVSGRAATQPGARLGLQPGNTIGRDDALKAILLESDNDAVIAAAEAAAGSVDKFVAAMNARAQKIGAEDTNFVNPTGAHDPRHFSTAHDMALIAREALGNPEFASLVRLRTATVKWSAKPQGKTITNRNKMLWAYGGCEGIKTGSTPEAGDCLAAAAARNDWRLLVVVLGATNAQPEGARLLDEGFSRYKRVRVLQRGRPSGKAKVKGGRSAQVPVSPTESFWLVMPKSVNPEVALQPEPIRLEAPVRKGQRAGKVTVMVHGKPRVTVPLVTAAAVEAAPWRWLGYLKAPAAVLFLLLATYWAMVRTRRAQSTA